MLPLMFEQKLQANKHGFIIDCMEFLIVIQFGIQTKIMLEEFQEVELAISGCGLFKCFQNKREHKNPLKHLKSPKRSLKRSIRENQQDFNDSSRKRHKNSSKTNFHKACSSLKEFYTSSSKFQPPSLSKIQHKKMTEQKIYQSNSSISDLAKQQSTQRIYQQNNQKYNKVKFIHNYQYSGDISQQRQLTRDLQKNKQKFNPHNSSSQYIYMDGNQNGIKKYKEESSIKLANTVPVISSIPRQHKNSFNSNNIGTQSTTYTNAFTSYLHNQYNPNAYSEVSIRRKQSDQTQSLQKMTDTMLSSPYQPRQNLNPNIFRSYGQPPKIQKITNSSKQNKPFEESSIQKLQKSRSETKLAISFIEQDSDSQSVVYQTHRQSGTQKITTLF